MSPPDGLVPTENPALHMAILEAIEGAGFAQDYPVPDWVGDMYPALGAWIERTYREGRTGADPADALDSQALTAVRRLQHARRTQGRAFGRDLVDVRPEPVSWLWPGYLPLGKLVLVEGHPGLGKSTFTLTVASAVTRGSGLPGMPGQAPAGVVLLSAEDGAADTIRPRVDAAGGDPRRIFLMEGVREPSGEEVPLSVTDHVAALEEKIRERGARLAILDPLACFLGSRTDSYKDSDIRRALMPLAALADRTGAAVVVVRHLVKRASGSAVMAGGGSVGIVGAARTALAVHADPDDPDRRLLAVVKSNLASPGPTRAFRLEDAGGAARLVWDGVVDLTGQQLHEKVLAAERGSDEGERSKLDEAADLLRDFLTGDPKDRKDVLRWAREQHISEPTLDRAAAKLGVTRQRSGFPPRSEWSLPSCATDSLTGPHARGVEGIGDLEGIAGNTGFPGDDSPGGENPLRELGEELSHNELGPLDPPIPPNPRVHGGTGEVEEDAEAIAEREAIEGEPAA